jgi:hypothetical protein
MNEYPSGNPSVPFPQNPLPGSSMGLLAPGAASRSDACPVRDLLLKELHRFEWTVSLPALRESIRLIASACFDRLTSAHIQDVANYRSIEVGEEVFFEKAFTPGKEAAVSLEVARCLGRDLVLDDLQRLEAVVAPGAD